LRSEIKRSVGIDIEPFIRNDDRLSPLIAEAVKENVKLITSIPEQYFNRLEKHIVDAVALGVRHEKLKEVVQYVGKVTENRAKLIARDQVSKLNGSINRIRQASVGIDEYVWSTSKDEWVRETHMENEGKRFRWDNPPAETGHPGEDIQCFSGDNQLHGTPFIEKFYRRFYTGELTELVLDNGAILRCTPNHPVFGFNGAKAAKLFEVGDNVIGELNQFIPVGETYSKNSNPMFEQLFSAINMFPAFLPTSVTGGEFHGDITDKEINIVTCDSRLILETYVCVCKHMKELGFTSSDMCFVWAMISSDCNFLTHLQRFGGAPTSLVSSFDFLLSLLRSQFTVFDLFCFASGACLDSKFFNSTVDDNSVNPEPFSDLIGAYTLLVEGFDFIKRKRDFIMARFTNTGVRIYSPSPEVLSNDISINLNDRGNSTKTEPLRYKLLRVVDKGTRYYSGHVYNLQTKNGYYNTSGALVANCRCVAIPYFNLDAMEAEMGL
jgi:SPP1 gp7 family putative phage head morphogenesis protein